MKEPTAILRVAGLKRLVILVSESEKIVYLNSRTIKGCSPNI